MYQGMRGFGETASVSFSTSGGGGSGDVASTTAAMLELAAQRGPSLTGKVPAFAKAEFDHKAAAEKAAGQASDAGAKLFAGDIHAYVATMKAAKAAISQYEQARAAAQVTRAPVSGVMSDARIQDYTDRIGDLEYAQGEMRKVLISAFGAGGTFRGFKGKKPTAGEAKLFAGNLFGRSTGMQNVSMPPEEQTNWLMIGVGAAVLLAVVGGGYWYVIRPARKG